MQPFTHLVSQKHPKQIIEAIGTNSLYDLLRLMMLLRNAAQINKSIIEPINKSIIRPLD